MPIAVSPTQQRTETPRACEAQSCANLTFDGSERSWCELVRDIVAVANSGGGKLLVAIVHSRHWPNDNAVRCGCFTSDKLANLLREFSGNGNADSLIKVILSGDLSEASIKVRPALIPVGFEKRGVCSQCEIFAAGSFYFRRGGMSVPGTSDDLQKSFRRLLRSATRSWMRELRRALGGNLVAESNQPRQGVPRPVRIVTDPEAPVLQSQDVERLYPLRQTDLVRRLNQELGRPGVNSYDIQAVRRQHRLDDRPDFIFHLPGAGRRYSPAAAEWIANACRQDGEFLGKARLADQATLRLRRKRPR